MDKKVKSDLRAVLIDMFDDYEAGLSQDNSVEHALKAIADLVVGTIPDKHSCNNDDESTERCFGFEDCRTEMLSRWTRKETK